MPTHIYVEELKKRCAAIDAERTEHASAISRLEQEREVVQRVIKFYDDGPATGGGAPVADKVRKAERAPKPAKRGRKVKGTPKFATGKAAVTLAERKSRGQKIDEMIKAGKSSQDIVDALDGAVSIGNVQVRKSKLKADGKL